MSNTYKVKADAKAVHNGDSVYGPTAIVEIAAIAVIKSEEEDGLFGIVLPAVQISNADAAVLKRLYPKRLEAAYDLLSEEMLLNAIAVAKR